MRFFKLLHKKYTTPQECILDLVLWELSVFAFVLGIIACLCSIYATLRYIQPRHAQQTSWISQQDITSFERNLASCVLDFVPHDVFNTVYQDGWSLTYIDQPIPQLVQEQQINLVPYADGYDIVGLAVLSRHQIYVSATVEDIIDATLHEIAHAYEYTLYLNLGSYISDSPEFIDLFNSESRGFPEYYQESPKEYFAEASDMYWMHPLKLRCLAPSTFEFMQRLYEE